MSVNGYRLNRWKVRLRYGSLRNYPVLADVPEPFQRAILMRIAYDPDWKFFYLRIPKAANSSVVNTLLKHMDGALGERAKNKERLNRLPSGRQFAEAYKFAMVRDPTTRALSGFLHRFRMMRSRPGEDWQADAAGFIEYLETLKSRDFLRNAHFIPQIHFLPGRGRDLDRMARIESFDTDMAAICTAIFGRYDGTLSERQHATDASAQAPGLLTPKACTLLTDLYGDDYDTLRYPRPALP